MHGMMARDCILSRPPPTCSAGPSSRVASGPWTATMTPLRADTEVPSDMTALAAPELLLPSTRSTLAPD
jgi:hypothetical protein